MTSVAIGLIDRGGPASVAGDTAHCLARLCIYTVANRVPLDVIRWQCGSMLDMGRNNLVEDFLRRDHEWLLWVDSDMTFPPDALVRLLEVADPDEAPVVGALTFGYKTGRGPYPVIYTKTYARNGDYGFQVVDGYPPDQVVEVGATGSAFILIHRTVFEKTRQPRPHYWYGYALLPGKDGELDKLGEDLSFCLLLAEHDIPIHVHTGVGTGHVKSFLWDEAAYQARHATFAAAFGLQEEEEDSPRLEDAGRPSPTD